MNTRHKAGPSGQEVGASNIQALLTGFGQKRLPTQVWRSAEQPKREPAPAPWKFRRKLYCRLREHLDERGLSMNSLARHAGVGRDAIGMLCRNDWQRVDRETLGRVCGALDVGLEDLFALHAEDIWFPIRLHRSVTIHIGSNPWGPQADSKSSDGLWPQFHQQSIGAWDFRAFRVLTKHLARLGRDITVRSEEHQADVDFGFDEDESAGNLIEQVFTDGDHIVIGSPIANRFAEEIVCRLFGVTPYTPSRRTAFPFAFVWDARRGVTPSSFGYQALGKDIGIADLRSGKLVARCNIVPQGEGQDCALILTFRFWKSRRTRQFGMDDERVIICLLGFSGAGTYAAAKAITDPKNAALLYPPEQQVPLMLPVTATTQRSATRSLRDTCRVTGVALVDVEKALAAPYAPQPQPQGSKPRPRRAAALNRSGRRPGRG